MTPPTVNAEQKCVSDRKCWSSLSVLALAIPPRVLYPSALKCRLKDSRSICPIFPLGDAWANAVCAAPKLQNTTAMHTQPNRPSLIRCSISTSFEDMGPFPTPGWRKTIRHPLPSVNFLAQSFVAIDVPDWRKTTYPVVGLGGETLLPRRPRGFDFWPVPARSQGCEGREVTCLWPSLPFRPRVHYGFCARPCFRYKADGCRIPGVS